RRGLSRPRAQSPPPDGVLLMLPPPPAPPPPTKIVFSGSSSGVTSMSSSSMMHVLLSCEPLHDDQSRSGGMASSVIRLMHRNTSVAAAHPISSHTFGGGALSRDSSPGWLPTAQCALAGAQAAADACQRDERPDALQQQEPPLFGHVRQHRQDARPNE